MSEHNDEFAAIRRWSVAYAAAEGKAWPNFEAAHALQALHMACTPERIAALLAAADRAKEQEADARLLDWLEAQTHRGHALNLVFDDDGHWAVSGGGMQPCPRGDGQGFDEPVQIGCFVEPHEWKPTIREAIRYAIAKTEEEDAAIDRAQGTAT